MKNYEIIYNGSERTWSIGWVNFYKNEMKYALIAAVVLVGFLAGLSIFTY